MAALAFVCAGVYAQNKGYVTGSLESNDHYYVEDKATDSFVRDDAFGMNNYLKLDYYNGNFSAGIRLKVIFLLLSVIHGSSQELILVICMRHGEMRIFL